MAGVVKLVCSKKGKMQKNSTFTLPEAECFPSGFSWLFFNFIFNMLSRPSHFCELSSCDGYYGLGFVSGSYTEGSSVEKPDSCQGEFKMHGCCDAQPLVLF